MKRKQILALKAVIVLVSNAGYSQGYSPEELALFDTRQLESIGPEKLLPLASLLAPPPPANVMLSPSLSLSIDGDFHLGGVIFKHAFPFLHSDAFDSLGHDIANTALGIDALTSSDIIPNAALGRYNTAVGHVALRANTLGYGNTAVGSYSLAGNTTATANSALGAWALSLNETGGGNSALGFFSLAFNTFGSGNTAIGANTLLHNAAGSFNTALGNSALSKNKNSHANTALGTWALLNNATGHSNTAVGIGSLSNNTTGLANIAVGAVALVKNQTGSLNTGVGTEALKEMASGDGNIALGYRSGAKHTDGDNNVFLANEGLGLENGTIRLGTDGTHIATYIAGISGQPVDFTNSALVRIDATGKLGTMPSSRRYKEGIRNMGEASQPLLELRPVTFRYKQNGTGASGPRQYGLIAEEVAAVLPDLVVSDEEGRPETVRYDLLSSMLVNELQNLHHRVEALESRLARQEDLKRKSAANFSTAPPCSPSSN